MDCPICRTTLTARKGQFGEFFFCPRQHGTISRQGNQIVATGEMFKWLHNNTHQSRLLLAAVHHPTAPNLEALVEAKMASYGVLLSDLDRFVEGTPEDADWDEDHWSNVRPY